MYLNAKKEDLQLDVDYWMSEMNRLDSFIESMSQMQKFIKDCTGGDYDEDDAVARFCIDQTVHYFFEKWYREFEEAYNKANEELKSLK